MQIEQDKAGDAAGWNPRPGDFGRKAYYAGYSDGWYGAVRYAAYATPQEAPSTYGVGFDHGTADRAKATGASS